jgi:hypothetical protein
VDLDIATRRFDHVGVTVDQAVPAFTDSYPAWWATMLRPSLMRVRLRFQDSYLAINAEVIEVWLAEPAGRPIECVGCAPSSDVSLSIESYRRYDAVTLVGATFWVHRRYREIVQQWLSSTWTPPPRERNETRTTDLTPHQIDQRLAAVEAENYRLRANLKRVEHDDT